MALPTIFVPRSLVDEAKAEAKQVVERALDGVFGLIDAAVKRRQSYAWAHEKALYHAGLVRRLRSTSIRIVDLRGKLRRHERKAMRFAALADARDPRLATACGICLDLPPPKD